MLAIAKKEIADALRNKLFLAILGMLLLLIIISVILGAYQVKVNVDAYNETVSYLQSIGKKTLPSPPNFNPLSASKNFANYIGFLGALMAIVMGNAAIGKERRGGTMRLVLSRRVYRDQFLCGKIWGNMALLVMICVFAFIISLLAALAISNAPITGDEIARQALFFLVSFLYMTFFMILGVFMAVVFRNCNKALLLTVVIWLVLGFILPQVGDTMDMDNQLPGGFFASMGMTKAQSQEVLDNFSFYETLRDGIEELSPHKALRTRRFCAVERETRF